MEILQVLFGSACFIVLALTTTFMLVSNFNNDVAAEKQPVQKAAIYKQVGAQASTANDLAYNSVRQCINNTTLFGHDSSAVDCGTRTVHFIETSTFTSPEKEQAEKVVTATVAVASQETLY